MRKILLLLSIVFIFISEAEARKRTMTYRKKRPTSSVEYMIGTSVMIGSAVLNPPKRVHHNQER